MALVNMDDKLLGEKVQCYISDDSEDEENSNAPLKVQNTAQHNPSRPSNTGPKGVLADYDEFQKTGVMPQDQQQSESSDSELDFSDEEEIFLSYKVKKMLQYEAEKSILENQKDKKSREDFKNKTYSGTVTDLDRESYAKVVESKGYVIILLYDALDDNSIVANKALNQLAKELPHVKFCRAEQKVILDSCSNQLASSGLPCVIGNFNGDQTGAIVWPEIQEELGDDFLPEQFLSLLRERNYV